jgi:hypothetical protein
MVLCLNFCKVCLDDINVVNWTSFHGFNLASIKSLFKICSWMNTKQDFKGHKQRKVFLVGEVGLWSNTCKEVSCITNPWNLTMMTFSYCLFLDNISLWYTYLWAFKGMVSVCGIIHWFFNSLLLPPMSKKKSMQIVHTFFIFACMLLNENISILDWTFITLTIVFSF